MSLVVLLWAFLVAPTPSYEGYLGLAIVAVAAWKILASIWDISLGPIAATFWPFILVWSGFAPLVQLNQQRLPWRDTSLEGLHPWAQLLLLAALGAHLFGGYCARLKLMQEKPPAILSTLEAKQERPKDRIWFAVLLALVLIPVTQTVGISLADRFTSRDELIAAYAEQGISYSGGQSVLLGFVKILPTAVGIVLAYAVIALNFGQKLLASAGKKSWLLIVFAVANLIVFANPLSNSRFLAFSGLLAVLFAVYRFHTQFRRGLMIVGMTFALAVLYPLAAWFKGDFVAARLVTGMDSYLTVDFDGFQQTVNALYYVQERGHSGGHFLISALGFWIPRQLWEGKSMPASFAVSAERGYIFQNLALPLWAEFYIDFGLLGMSLLFFLIGWHSLRLDHAFNKDRTSPVAHIAALLGALQIGFLRGPMGAQVSFAGTVVIIGCLIFVSRRTSEKRAMEPPGIASGRKNRMTAIGKRGIRE